MEFLLVCDYCECVYMHACVCVCTCVRATIFLLLICVDRNPFAPRNNEEHSIGLVKCKKCIRTQQENRVRFFKTVH